MFAKLTHKYPVDTYQEKEEYVSYGETVDGKFKGIKYLNTHSGSITAKYQANQDGDPSVEECE